MQHTLRFLSGDDGPVLREETTLAYGLMSGPPGRHAGHR
jgi:hypothetical protein